MQKIPTMFNRDWDGDKSRVIDQPHPDCTWVFDGEGRATVKLDGTCVMVRDGKRYKRRELREKDQVPADFELLGYDGQTNKTVGWMPVGPGPEDRWHREARGGERDGTYELVGPKLQGNAESWDWHELIPHGLFTPITEPKRTFDGIRDWFMENTNIEGLVYHHPDGRMAKIKLRDFGIKRLSARTQAKPAAADVNTSASGRAE